MGRRKGVGAEMRPLENKQGVGFQRLGVGVRGARGSIPLFKPIISGK